MRASNARRGYAARVVWRTWVVVLAMTAGCGGNVVEVVSADGGGSSSSSGGGAGSSGSGSGGEGGPGQSACSRTTCAGCCNSNGFCAVGSGDVACGVGGSRCQDCTTTGSNCQGGTCVQPMSSSGSPSGACTCPGGCCDATGACYAGVIDGLCGSTGGMCADCTVSGLVCQAGTCAPPAAAPTCVGTNASSCHITCVPLSAPCCKGDGGACGCTLPWSTTCR